MIVNGYELIPHPREPDCWTLRRPGERRVLTLPLSEEEATQEALSLPEAVPKKTPIRTQFRRIGRVRLGR
jgi:hypothetical protein